MDAHEKLPKRHCGELTLSVIGVRVVLAVGGAGHEDAPESPSVLALP